MDRALSLFLVWHLHLVGTATALLPHCSEVKLVCRHPCRVWSVPSGTGEAPRLPLSEQQLSLNRADSSTRMGEQQEPQYVRRPPCAPL